MEHEFKWTIAQLERKSDNGFITNIHWRYSLTDGDYYADTYSVESYTQETEHFILFNDIIEEDIIAWLESSMGETKMVEMRETLQKQIEFQKNPPILYGFPWEETIGTPPHQDIE